MFSMEHFCIFRIFISISAVTLSIHSYVNSSSYILSKTNNVKTSNQCIYLSLISFRTILAYFSICCTPHKNLYSKSYKTRKKKERKSSKRLFRKEGKEKLNA